MSRIRSRAFTIVEMLVVVTIIALLMGLLFSALKGVKETSREAQCANNLKQLGTATFAYIATYKDHLPQVAAENPFTGQQEIIGSLFGGKRGQLAMFGIDQIGVDSRPLNKFVSAGGVFVDTDLSDGIDEDIPVFQCPLDRGQPAQPPFLPQVDTMYDFVGSSYTLNDHANSSEACGTLIPKKNVNDKPGGRMPRVAWPDKCWMLGDLPIYNYQEGGDRGQRWHKNDNRCCLCFVDGHVAGGVQIRQPLQSTGLAPETTPEYSFLPSPKWDCDPFTDGVQPSPGEDPTP